MSTGSGSKKTESLLKCLVFGYRWAVSKGPHTSVAWLEQRICFLTWLLVGFGFSPGGLLHGVTLGRVSCFPQDKQFKRKQERTTKAGHYLLHPCIRGGISSLLCLICQNPVLYNGLQMSLWWLYVVYFLLFTAVCSH